MSGCDRVLRLLSDRQPHTHHELYDLNVIAHSRVSDLRKRGHVIEQWREGDDYLYQLVGSAPVADGKPVGADVGLVPDQATVEPAQLSFEVAA